MLYRRRQCIFLFLCASTFWIAYIFLTFPSDVDKNRIATDIDSSRPQEPKEVEAKGSIVRKVTTQKYQPEQADPSLQKAVDVIHQPPVVHDTVNDIGKIQPHSSDLIGHNETLLNSSAVQTNGTSPVKEVGNLDKVLEIGEKIKNKTFEVGANLKNKTLEKLSEMGVIKSKNFVKYLFAPSVWSANVSVEDVANIMKDTKYLNKLQELEKSYQRIVPQFFGKNKTVASNNITNYGIGLCDCLEVRCQCCVRITNAWMHLNSTSCANFTFVTKSQELDLNVILDGNSVYKNSISVEVPPKVCLGSLSKVVDLCVEFKNMTSHIEMHEEHKIHLFGCTDFTLNLFNKTVSSFPVDCFQLPTDEDLRKQHLQKHNMNIGNWMP
ncbi:hypothetical protein ScPMuIL_016060 [Solemya velum]